MADGTSIEWARHPVTGRGASWNPLLARTKETGKVGYHCEHASPGCVNCYAEAFNRRRLPARGTGLSFHPGYRNILEIFLDDRMLLDPIRWREPRGIFVCSMTDLFGVFVPIILIDRMMAIACLAQHHVYMVLTKRPERAREYLSDPATPARIAYQLGVLAAEHPELLQRTIDASQSLTLGGWPLRSVWLGTSVEDQRRANERIPELLEAPAAVRFLSVEPILEPIDLRAFGMAVHHHPDNQDSPELRAIMRAARSHLSGGKTVDWVIAGFESGTQARAAADAPDIARSLRDQCAAAGVPFFFKQWGSWAFAPDGMNYQDAMAWGTRQRYSLSRKSEAWGGSGGLPTRYQQFSNGRTAFYTGKKDAGRLLDGVEHNAMPELR